VTTKFLSVFIGSGLGGILRFAVQQYFGSENPMSLIIVNGLGAFGIGVAFQFFQGEDVTFFLPREFWMAGLLGGLTTFSGIFPLVEKLASEHLNWQMVVLLGFHIFLGFYLFNLGIRVVEGR